VLLYYTGTGNSKSKYSNLDTDIETETGVEGPSPSGTSGGGPIGVHILQDPKQPEYRVVRGVATKQLWQRLSDGMVKNNSISSSTSPI